MLADIHINQLLDNFLTQREDEVLEFKEAKKGLQTDELRKYISALSNEANLRRKEFAWLIYGVSDNLLANLRRDDCIVCGNGKKWQLTAKGAKARQNL